MNTHSKIKVEIRAELRTPQGKLIKRYPWRRANSLIKQFIQLLACQVTQTNQTIKDTGNTDRNVPVTTLNLGCTPVAGATTNGILIGTGTTPVTMADYKLETQVTASITHPVQSYAVENPDASTWRLAISRVLTNNTGSTLSIKEVALYIMGGSTPWFFCADRTLYSVDVPNSVGVTFTYRITITL